MKRTAGTLIVLAALSGLVYSRLQAQLLQAVDLGLQARAGAIASGIGQQGVAIGDAPDTGPIGNIPFGLLKPSRLPCPPATSNAATSPRRSAASPSARIALGGSGARPKFVWMTIPVPLMTG